jgi:hypothetical protein
MEEEEAGVRRWLVDVTRVAPFPQLSSAPQPHSFIRTSAPPSPGDYSAAAAAPIYYCPPTLARFPDRRYNTPGVY